MKKIIATRPMKAFFIGITLLTVTFALNVQAHCQIPCGIYDDAARFTSMREHVTTIEKSMNEIEKMTTDGPKVPNQLIRWVDNKEAHADKLTEIVTYYFLAQRIKSTEPAEKYEPELKLLHGMIVQSMKAKQTTDLQHVEKLRELINQFEKVYTGKLDPPPHTH